MQALFALKKNCLNICRREAKFLPPAFFYLRELRRTPIEFERQKKIAGNPPIKNILEF